MVTMRRNNRRSNRLKGDNRNNRFRGTRRKDTILGLGGDDLLLGFNGNDRLNGGTGNDQMDGGRGADTLIGGRGNDSYAVDNLGDRTIELNNQGVDVVFASINWELAENLEILVLQGSAVFGIGNSLNNEIFGNAADNVLNGGAGNDGLSGGTGNDTYFVNSPDDRVFENGNEGIDLVASDANFYFLDDNVENLELFGNADSRGSGNELNNFITGNSGNNLLDGGAGNDGLNGGRGADDLIGGQGDDSYVVDNLGDRTIELNNQGVDVVFASIDWELAENLEILVLEGSAAVGIGNSLNNEIFGNSANNVLDGGLGDDTLTGGAGNDILTGGSGSNAFTFTSGSETFTNANFGVDEITDFSVQYEDTLLISKRTFGLASEADRRGFTVASEFESVINDSVAATSSAIIVYSEATKTLFYNPNGSAAGFGAAGASGAFAIVNVIDTPTLSASDFFISSS
jgi:Ca2+-binding RTX toxin-like protein